ncbi:hypothetical protein TD95_002393 [Thielaviopsis punctulata]|uniref:Uncharacterized protein n=1 Tax=Thielaviopsis punctulata TaxID=72032 RepID=A0A0F4ZCD3_9PEZI|nr:hypothetical protein TD95_002393 [Thielaviopsis punctulata]
MYFSTTTISLLVASLASTVSAHGHLVNPAALKNTTPLQDIRIPVNGCGTGVVTTGPVQATFKAGSTANAIWSVTNGDGAGPLSVKFDTSGAGTNFNTVAQITTNLDGQNGGVPNSFPRGDHTIVFKVPNTKCARCVMQVRQAITGNNGFGSCAVVSIQ